jgi:hypothetical protein
MFRSPTIPTLTLPPVGDIKSVKATLHGFHDVFQPIAQFEVQREDWGELLGWLRPARYESTQWPLDKIDQLGVISIVVKDGRQLHLRFYWTGHNPVLFSPDGTTQFVGHAVNDFEDGGLQLAKAIRHLSCKAQ